MPTPPSKRQVISSELTLKRWAKPKRGKEIRNDKEVASLTCVQNASGLKTWYLQQRWPPRTGAVRKFKPRKPHEQSNGHLALDDIRQLARAWKSLIASGVDPEVQVRDIESQSNDTFQGALERFLNEHVSTLKPKSQGDIVRAFRHHRFDAWRSLRLEQITKRRVAELLNTVAVLEGHPTMANRLRAYLSKFFRWCGEQALWADEKPLPTDRVGRYSAGERKRDRVLTNVELRLLLQATAGRKSLFDLHLRLILATGQRKDEVARLCWTDIDHDLWRQADNKASRQHEVPLNWLSLETLESTPRLESAAGLVFTTTGNTAISGWSKYKRSLDARLLEMAATQQLDAFSTPWGYHDVRRTLATRLREMGFADNVPSLVLNHKRQDVTGKHYDLYDGLAEKRRALDAWGQYLLRLIEGARDNNVVQLHA